MRRMITSIEIWNKIASISCNWKLYQGNVERTFHRDDLEWRKSFGSKCGKVSWLRDNFFSIARHHLYLKYWQRNNERRWRKVREATKGVYKAKMTAKKLDFRQERCFRSCFSQEFTFSTRLVSTNPKTQEYIPSKTMFNSRRNGMDGQFRPTRRKQVSRCRYLVYSEPRTKITR